MAHATTATAGQFNELDPHGAGGHGQHASHVIVGPFTLRTILVLLMFFTLLTVGQALAEQWIQTTFNILLPKWVNVAIVLAIATVKGLLVMAYFMQLRYDNPMNTILMLFCFFTAALFLGLTGIDVFNRATVYDFKGQLVQPGGTGAGVQARSNADEARQKGGRIDTGGKSPVEAARERWAKQWGPEKFKIIEADVAKHAHGHAGPAPITSSSAQASRPLTGLTGATDLAPSEAPVDAHGAEKSGH